MLDESLRSHLQDGVTIVVGVVDRSGAPIAGRGYGAEVVDDTHVRVFLASGDARLVDHVRTSGRLAVTTGDVFTFKSVQFKGTVDALAPTSESEHASATSLQQRFHAKLAELQNVPVVRLTRRSPSTFVACLVRVTEIFDQSPGPNAGISLSRPER